MITPFSGLPHYAARLIDMMDGAMDGESSRRVRHASRVSSPDCECLGDEAPPDFPGGRWRAGGRAGGDGAGGDGAGGGAGGGGAGGGGAGGGIPELPEDAASVVSCWLSLRDVRRMMAVCRAWHDALLRRRHMLVACMWHEVARNMLRMQLTTSLERTRAYMRAAPQLVWERSCDWCAAAPPANDRFLCCAAHTCRASYCCRVCQRLAWHAGHSATCPTPRRLPPVVAAPAPPNGMLVFEWHTDVLGAPPPSPPASPPPPTPPASMATNSHIAGASVW